MAVEKAYKIFDIDNALTLLENHGERAELLAGGTDLLVRIKEKTNRSRVIIDIFDIKEMKKIEIMEDKIVLGALTTFSEIVENSYIKENIPGLWKAARSVGSPQIRNMGTVGGNICNASPAADVVVPLLALDARLIIKNKKEEKSVGLDEFYLGKGETRLRSNEILTNIIFPSPKNKKINIGFEKLGLRNALAISRINCAVYLELQDKLIKDVRIGSGALGAYPLREYDVEAYIRGKALKDRIIEEAAKKYSQGLKRRLAGRSSYEYKREAVKNIFKNAVYYAVN